MSDKQSDTPKPPALLPPARLAEIRERARLSSLPHVAELLAHLDALAPCEVDGEALGRDHYLRLHGAELCASVWPTLPVDVRAKFIAAALALHDIGYARRRSEGEAELARLADALECMRVERDHFCAEKDRIYREEAQVNAEIARLTAELAEARALHEAVIEQKIAAHAEEIRLLAKRDAEAIEQARLDGAREERREWSALLAIVDRITFDAPDDKPNGPGEQAIDDMSKALEVDRWPSNVRSRIADLNGHMATLCDALADDCRDLKAAADALRARGEDRPPCPGAGWEWDAFALQWFQPGAKGKAIAVPNRAGGAGGAG